METKDDFLIRAKVTKENQIYGTLISKSKNGTGDSLNDILVRIKRKLGTI